MIKSYKKLYKAKKNWVVATAVTATILGGSALTTSVHADTVSQPTTNTTQTVEPQLTAVSQDTQTQSASQAQTDQSTVDQQKQDLQDQINQDQTKLDQAKQTKVQKQTDVNNATQQLQNDQQAQQNEYQSNKELVDQNVQDAQKTVSQIKDQQASQEQNQQTQQLDQQIQDKQNQVNQLQNTNADLQTQKDNVETNVNAQYASQKSDAQNELSGVQSRINDLNNQITQKQSDLQNAQSRQSVIPSNYIQGEYSYSDGTEKPANTSSDSYADTNKSLLENILANNDLNNALVSQDGKSDLPDTVYVTPDANKTQYNSQFGSSNYINGLYEDPRLDHVDPVNGMTDKQKQELNTYLMMIINNARIARGEKPFISTYKKFQQAQVRASQNSAFGLVHDTNDMISAFGSDQWENLAYISGLDYKNYKGQNYDNMYLIFAQAYSSVSSMLNADADSNWGHRENFLWPSSQDETYDAAFGFHYVTNKYGQKMYTLTFDFNTVPNDQVDPSQNMLNVIDQYKNEGKITPTSSANTQEVEQLQSEITQLQNELATAKQAESDAQTSLDNLNQWVAQEVAKQTSQIQTKIDQNNNQINSLKNDIQSLETEKSNIQTSSFDYSKLTQNQKDAYDKAMSAINDANDNLKVLNSQTDAVYSSKIAADKVALKNAQDNLATAHQVVLNLTRDLNAKQDQLAKLNNTEVPVSASATPAKPTESSSTSASVVPAKPTESSSASASTTPVKPTVSIDGHNGHQSTKPATTNQPASDTKANQLANYQRVTVVATDKAVKHAASTETVVKPVQKATAATNSKQLPQTGNQNEMVLTGLGMASLVSMLGLAGLTKKRG